MMKRWAVVLFVGIGIGLSFGWGFGPGAVRMSAAELSEELDSASQESTAGDLTGDELAGEVITSTVKDEMNTVQINFHAIMPRDFGSGVCLEMLENKGGNIYRILAANVNDYLGKMFMFVPEGAYTILDCYVEGDNTANTKIEYEQESVSNNGSGIVNFYSDDVIYDDNYSIVVKVVKTGASGEGEFRYSLNGGFLWSEDISIPAEGLFLIPDTGLWIEFFDNGGEFMVGDVYKTKIKGDMSQHDYTPVIAGLLVVLFMVMTGVYYHYASQRDRTDQYELMKYERVK